MSVLKSMESWSVLLKGLDEVPEPFITAMGQVLADNNAFPYTVYTPEIKDPENLRHGTVLAFADKGIWVLENVEGEVSSIRLPIDGLQSVELGTVLLQSWMKFCSILDEGYACKQVYFNTVTIDLFTAIMDDLRCKVLQISVDESKPKIDALDYLYAINFKFASYGKMSLIPGQVVYGSVFQEQFGHEKPHLCILADKELILIKETELVDEKSLPQKYSGIWTHIPLRSITGINLVMTEDGHGEKLVLMFEGQAPTEILFDLNNHDSVYKFVDTLKTFINQQNG